MISTLIFAFVLAMVVAFAVMPKAGVFIFRELKALMALGRYAPSTVAIIVVFEAGLAVAAFIFFKFCLSLWAYGFAGDVVEHFILSRGVFSIESGAQFALQPKSLAMLVGTVLLKFLACAFIYNRTGYFLQQLQHYRPEARHFDLGIQILLAFSGVAIFMTLEVMFLAQNIALVSKYSNLILLTIANLSLIAFFVSLIHLRYKKDHPEYFVDLQTYVNVDRPLLRVLQSHMFTILGILIFGLVLHLPHYLGLQFLEDNILLVLVMLVVMLAFIFVIFRKFFVKLFDVLTRVFLLPHFGSEPITTNVSWTTHLKYLKWLLSILLLVTLVKMPSLLSFLVLGIAGAGLTSVGAILFFGITLSLVFALMQLLLPKDTSISHSTHSFNLARTRDEWREHLLAMSDALRPGYAVILLLAILIIGFPKPYPVSTSGFSPTVFDSDSVILYQEKSAEGFLSVPVQLSSVPSHFVDVLLLQEDRGLRRQRSWLPNRHNWFGISATSLVRFVTRQGGGSNITNQLCKNEAFQGKRVQDVQRKFFELLASFQISLSTKPMDQLELYVNRVSLFGGKGHKGLYMASTTAFSKPPAAINHLQSLLLVRSLQYGRYFPLLDGRKIPYDSTSYYEKEVSSTLLARYSLWRDQEVIDNRLYTQVERQPLFEARRMAPYQLATSSRQLLKRHFAKAGGAFQTSLRAENQKLVTRTLSEFDKRMRWVQKKGPYSLKSAAIAIHCPTGEVVAHHGGKGVTDLADFGEGYQMGSIMKPFVLMELLEKGWEPDELRLFDGSREGRKTVQNFSRKYSNQYVGLEEMLAKSLNAPFHNISELTPAIDLFKQVENRFGIMGLQEDQSIDLDDAIEHQSYLQNYPLGLRRMTLMDVAQAYQALFNQGVSRPLTLRRNLDSPSRMIYQSESCDEVLAALASTVAPGGTGTHFVSLLPARKTFYAKTGTSDEAIHGWTVLSDGELLVVAFVTYGAVIKDRLELNRTPAIPTGSGAQTAGVLAALLYKSLTSEGAVDRSRDLIAMGG